MNKLRIIGRRFSNGIGLVLSTLGIMAAIGIIVILIIGGLSGVVYLFNAGRSALETLLIRIGVPPEWTSAALVLLVFMMVIFVIGFSSTPFSEVTVFGVEPGKQQEDTQESTPSHR